MDLWTPIVKVLEWTGISVATRSLQTAQQGKIQLRNTDRMIAANERMEIRRMEFQERQRHDTLKAQVLMQAWNTDRMIAANENLEAKRQKFQEMQRLHNLAFQAQEGRLNRAEQEKNRQLQAWLAELNRELTKQEGRLNRQLQRELADLNRQVQINEGKLNREHALRLEEFRAEMQRWAFAQQRELQLQLKQLDADLALELRRYDRETALNQLREQRRLSNLPICLLSEQILSTDAQQDFPPLRIFFSPPNVRFDQTVNPKHSIKHFPALEEHLSESALGGHIRAFLNHYEAAGRPVRFIDGAWKAPSSRTVSHRAAAKSLFAELKTEPVLLLESELTGSNLDILFAFWGMNWAEERYAKAMSFSWRETLYASASERALRWQEQSKGEDEADLLHLYGAEAVRCYRENLKIAAREKLAADKGIDPASIERHYALHEQDYENLSRFTAISHCLVAGLLADEYFLLHLPPDKRRPPLLPALLPDLLAEAPDTVFAELLGLADQFYRTLYAVLAEEESAWLPELYLDMALSAAALPDKSWAEAYMKDSVRIWLEQRGLETFSDEDVSFDKLIAAMKPALSSLADAAYLHKFDQCLTAIA